MIFSEELISKIEDRLDLHRLKLILNPAWKSEIEGHRQFIHADLKNRLANDSHQLSSISHSFGLGGYLLCGKAQGLLQIGFDLEKVDRIQPEVVRRICKDQQEFQQAPSASALWCAKEASFKAMKNFSQPQVVSAIEIHHWSSESHFDTFHFLPLKNEKHLEGLGLTWTQSDYQFAISRIFHR